MTDIQAPDQIYGELFAAVQNGHVFEDSKTFVDCFPAKAPAAILKAYQKKKSAPEFDLKTFVLEHFSLPDVPGTEFKADGERPIREHIDLLWDALRRDADDPDRASSLFPLPHPYVVPGGRFGEIYYWDSYFTMLGLATAGRLEMVENMVKNFAHLIDKIGFIPNGNRNYFCTRSQPPFFALMVELFAEQLGNQDILVRYYPQVRREYAFWMDGAESLTDENPAHRRVVKLGNAFLNRYWDDATTPRQESYREDLELAGQCDRQPGDLYRDVRAGAESGWDFTSRWFADPMDMATIRTTQVLPVDLNSLMLKVEQILAHMANLSGQSAEQAFYLDRADRRKQIIQDRFYDSDCGFFTDLLLNKRRVETLSVAGAFPLFVGIATESQAERVAERLRTDFLRSGGWVTTLVENGQQWDFPNGWAPLQWIIYVGLVNYGLDDDALEGATRWVNNNLHVYRETGKLIEKYNVEDVGLLASGGEYAVQDGFGWTNGVLLKLLDLLEL